MATHQPKQRGTERSASSPHIKALSSRTGTWRNLLCLSIALFIGYFLFLSFARHENIHSLRIDLGNMDQTVWNVAHGNGFTLTDPMGTAQESRLAIHADFLLILMAPLYFLWSDPRMLLIVQAIALASGAIPLFWLAQKVLKKEWVAYLLSVSYLLYPTVGLNALHDFHATSISTPFLLFAFWYLVDDRPWLFAVFAGLAAMGKEQFWAVTALLGILWIAKKQYRAFGLAVTAVSSVIFYLLFWKFIPSVTPSGQHWALIYLSDYGGNISDIVKSLLLHPVAAIGTAIAPDRLYYYFQLLFPVGFFSLFAPQLLLLTLPNLAINVLSSDTLMRMIDYQYTSGITPWVFVSAVYGWKTFEKFLSRVISARWATAFIALVFFLCTAWSSYLWGEYPYGAKSRFRYFQTRPPEASAILSAAMSIPSRYSVSATNNIGAHFSDREHLYTFPVNAEHADYVVALLGDQYAWPSRKAQSQAVARLLGDPAYTLLVHTGSFYAFRKTGLRTH
ncbi:DUF2079 domain-containing protein [Patescibacteria group bacterium]|nr:DUF2079 domain-containing protein [Patescibacteria group bacterium]